MAPLVATLALAAAAPLPTAALHALMVRRVLATDDDVGRAAVVDALAQLAGVVGRSTPTAAASRRGRCSTRRCAPTSAPRATQAMAIATARLALAAAARDHRDDAVAGYLDDHGVGHLCDADELAGAPRRWRGRGCGTGWPGLARSPASAPICARSRRGPRPATPAASPVAELAAFVDAAAHHVERGGAWRWSRRRWRSATTPR
ncbi:MAG: hypothetical protein H6708_10425 [Kofleriaceae bacterium]|nr:hypothetical protein [Kofleriaceae bacterium]